jgi:hypothetical protein
MASRRSTRTFTSSSNATICAPSTGELRLVKAFAHYTGDRPDEIRQRYGRAHDDVLYEKQL